MNSDIPPFNPTIASAGPGLVRSRAFGMLLAWACLFAVNATAGIVVAHYDFTGINQVVPDGDEFGLSDARNVSGLDGPIESVTVRLQLDGGYNGDLYVSLSHLGSTAVLLNRVGRRSNTGVGQYGYGDPGFQVAFDDNASNGDAHVYRLQFNLELDPDQRQNVPLGGPLTGTWAPDGRTDDPDQVLIESPRTAFLTKFTGLSADGTWTLFAADLESGEEATLVSWGMDIAVPEPLQWTMLAGVGLLGWALRRRRLCVH